MNKNTLVCDSCGEEHIYAALIKKPFAYVFKSQITPLAQINTGGRKQDIVCLRCLTEEIEEETELLQE